MKTMPSVEVMRMWMEQWKLSYSVSGGINLAFIVVDHMSVIEHNSSVPRYMFEKFLHMYIKKHIKKCSMQHCYETKRLRKRKPDCLSTQGE